MAHFTCVGATVDELRATLDEMCALGFDNVLALRGDPPQGQEEWTKTEGGLEYSRELVELIRGDYPFAIGAAASPRRTSTRPRAEDDLRYLKEKVDAGVDFLITQLFFDNALYFDFVARARAIGIDVPIIPGILPITNFTQLERMTRCAARRSRTTCSPTSTSAERATRRWPSSASPTRRCSAPSCWPAARRASTSTR